MKKSVEKKNYPRKRSELLVTQPMLFGVRNELRAQIGSLNEKLDSKFNELKSEIHGVKSEIHGIKSEIGGLKAEIHRTNVLMEEQNARNAVVFDALGVVLERQERMEHELTEQAEFRKNFLKLKST